MQYPVPQFTDVEDRIIGPLTVKQFIILFVAGIFIFLGYSISKSVLVVVFVFVLLGVPAIGIAFGKINGRPVYNTFGLFIKYLSSPKLLIFHKEAATSSVAKFKDLQTEIVAQAPEVALTVNDTKKNLAEVQKLLRKTQEQEMAILQQHE